MIDERDLYEAIDACQKEPVTYQSIQKMANFIVVLEYLQGNRGYSNSDAPAKEVENIISHHGDSEFLRAVRGRKSDDVWPVIDELMEFIRVTSPRLYDGVLKKIDS